MASLYTTHGLVGYIMTVIGLTVLFNFMLHKTENVAYANMT
uniref:Uncharacterized protein n=1 Tax=Anguilla anguilla TaxID=7936 RepID=A0A0E9VP71_ANGAN